MSVKASERFFFFPESDRRGYRWQKMLCKVIVFWEA